MSVKRAYLKNQVVGNMRIVSFAEPTATVKGLMPHYVCECCNCGKVKKMSQDALRKRANTGAIKCGTCSQVKTEGRSKKSGKITNYQTHDGFNAELHNKFISMRL
jgi:transcription elongation factor Elf1